MPGFPAASRRVVSPNAGAKPPEPAQVVDSDVALWGHDDTLNFSQGRQ